MVIVVAWGRGRHLVSIVLRLLLLFYHVLFELVLRHVGDFLDLLKFLEGWVVAVFQGLGDMVGGVGDNVSIVVIFCILLLLLLLLLLIMVFVFLIIIFLLVGDGRGRRWEVLGFHFARVCSS